MLDVRATWLVTCRRWLDFEEPVTVSSKLLLAVALVASGFGVGKLLGEPAQRTLARLQAPLANPAKLFARTIPTPPTAGGARLVPDFGATASNDRVVAFPRAPVAAPLLPDDTTPFETAQSTSVPFNDNIEASFSIREPRFEARATLRNEAPRPLTIESRLPSAVSTPSPNAPATTQPVESQSVTYDSIPWNPPVQTAGGMAPSNALTPAIPASYNDMVPQVASIVPIAPPPWPAPEESQGPRAHIVVDGDTLARLAGRYLDDPRRSNEIYEANRGALTDPELLPIGVELVIPARGVVRAFDPQSPQSFLPRAIASHTTASGSLVPVGPVPSSSHFVPRAHLTRPLPVE